MKTYYINYQLARKVTTTAYVEAYTVRDALKKFYKAYERQRPKILDFQLVPDD